MMMTASYVMPLSSEGGTMMAGGQELHRHSPL